MILIAITALSCVSSFLIYRLGFADLPYIVEQMLSLFAVVVVEGACQLRSRPACREDRGRRQGETETGLCRESAGGS